MVQSEVNLIEDISQRVGRIHRSTDKVLVKCCQNGMGCSLPGVLRGSHTRYSSVSQTRHQLNNGTTYGIALLLFRTLIDLLQRKGHTAGIGIFGIRQTRRNQNAVLKLIAHRGDSSIGRIVNGLSVEQEVVGTNRYELIAIHLVIDCSRHFQSIDTAQMDNVRQLDGRRNRTFTKRYQTDLVDTTERGRRTSLLADIVALTRRGYHRTWQRNDKLGLHTLLTILVENHITVFDGITA